MTPAEREALLFLLRYAAQLAGGPPAVGSITKIERLIRDIEAEAETDAQGDGR
jgi:hypothetical protein